MSGSAMRLLGTVVEGSIRGYERANSRCYQGQRGNKECVLVALRVCACAHMRAVALPAVGASVGPAG